MKKENKALYEIITPEMFKEKTGMTQEQWLIENINKFDLDCGDENVQRIIEMLNRI